MKNHFRRSYAAFAAVLLMLTAAGCSGGAAATTAAPAQTQAAAPTQAAAQTQAAETAPAQTETAAAAEAPAQSQVPAQSQAPADSAANAGAAAADSAPADPAPAVADGPVVNLHPAEVCYYSGYEAPGFRCVAGAGYSEPVLSAADAEAYPALAQALKDYAEARKTASAEEMERMIRTYEESKDDSVWKETDYSYRFEFNDSLSFPRADIQFKCAVENIFDEAYISVLSHPMPGRHFEVFVAVTPRR